MRELILIAVVALLSVVTANAGAIIAGYEYKIWLQEREEINESVRSAQ